MMTSTSIPSCRLNMSLASGAMALACWVEVLLTPLEEPSIAPARCRCFDGAMCVAFALSRR